MPGAMCAGRVSTQQPSVHTSTDTPRDTAARPETHLGSAPLPEDESRSGGGTTMVTSHRYAR
jgi:hypothetical protein